MSETKKRVFTLELTDKEMTAFVKKCFQDGTTPSEVLEGFICDLTGVERTHGSDEEMYSSQYYERCGYGYFFPNEKRSFAQWILRDYGSYTLELIINAVNDIECFENEIAYLKKHSEEYEEGEIEDLEEDIKNSKEDIDEYYQEYIKSTTQPETLEEGIKGIIEYLEIIENI